jgi:hypothetical protein
MRDTAESRRPFTAEDVRDKPLVVSMLKYEDSIMRGPVGAAIFADSTIPHLTELDTYYIFHRMALAEHGFTTTDADVQTYRTIFANYYNGPRDFDADVLGSVCYMRENKCVYYTAPPINVGDVATDAELMRLDGAPTSLHKELAALPHKYVFVGAFSNS